MPFLLPQENASHALKGTSHNFHRHSFMKIRMGIIGQNACHQLPERGNPFLRDWFRPLASANHFDDTNGFQNRQFFSQCVPSECRVRFGHSFALSLTLMTKLDRLSIRSADETEREDLSFGRQVPPE